MFTPTFLIFGSTLKGYAREESDVDVCVISPCDRTEDPTIYSERSSKALMDMAKKRYESENYDRLLKVFLEEKGISCQRASLDLSHWDLKCVMLHHLLVKDVLLYVHSNQLNENSQLRIWVEKTKPSITIAMGFKLLIKSHGNLESLRKKIEAHRTKNNVDVSNPRSKLAHSCYLFGYGKLLLTTGKYDDYVLPKDIASEIFSLETVDSIERYVENVEKEIEKIESLENLKKSFSINYEQWVKSDAFKSCYNEFVNLFYVMD